MEIRIILVMGIALKILITSNLIVVHPIMRQMIIRQTKMNLLLPKSILIMKMLKWSSKFHQLEKLPWK